MINKPENEDRHNFDSSENDEDYSPYNGSRDNGSRDTGYITVLWLDTGLR